MIRNERESIQNHPTPAPRTILVTGSTGTVGRQVVSQLLASDAAVRALARQPASARLPAGVEIVRGDLSAPDSLARCLAGVDAVFLLWPFFTVDAAPPVLEAMAEHARRVVYLSAPGGLFHAEMERLIESSGLDWTFLRPTGFASNTLGWAEQIRRDSVVRWPSGGAARALIHEKDIAAVAVRALTGDGHSRATYLLTGPETLTQIEQARQIGRAIGREVRYEELSREAARQQLLAAWGNPAFVDAALDGWARMVAEPETVTRTVEEVTGARAHTFAEWAADHAEDFR